MAELRLCVGTETGPRSTVWKVVTRKADVYIISRLMGFATKVSLHGSGRGQFSFTTRWAQERNIPSARRHIDRWTVRQPTPTKAAHVFRLLFPHDELITVGTPNKAPSIRWVDPPPPGHCVILELYLAPHPPDAALNWDVPFPLIGVLPLAPHGSLAILRNQEPLDAAKLAAIRAARWSMRRRTERPRPGTKLPIRGTLLLVFEDHTRGFMEIAPENAAA